MLEKKIREMNKTACEIASSHGKQIFNEVQGKHKSLEEITNVSVNIAVKVMVDIINIMIDFNKAYDHHLCPQELVENMFVAVDSLVARCDNEQHRLGKH